MQNSENGNSADKLRHPRTDADSAEQVLLNKQQIWGGGACLHYYPKVIRRLLIFHTTWFASIREV